MLEKCKEYRVHYYNNLCPHKMGWSCSDKAAKVLDQWSKACLKQTGNCNFYKVKDRYYHFEISRTEHDDGSITGTIRKYITYNPDNGSGMTVQASSFKIDGSGVIIRAPKFLKQAIDLV